MHTVILRLASDASDGQLHGVLEIVGSEVATTFTDDATLLALLHEVIVGGRPVAGPDGGSPEPHLNAGGQGADGARDSR